VALHPALRVGHDHEPVPRRGDDPQRADRLGDDGRPGRRRR
jgi:hypothetical protein